MTPEKFKRKLAAILSADVKGYSRLMGEDEEGTIRTLSAYKEVMTGFIQKHQGRVVGTAGDSVLAEFASVVDAVRCAVEIQEGLRDRNKELPEGRRVEFRIGVNLGDVVEDGNDILGDGVNIAARVQSLAEAGGICISGTVYEHIKDKLAFGYEYVGEQVVKNIKGPVRIYQVVMEPGGRASIVAAEGKAEKKKRPIPLVALGAVIVIAAAAVIGYFYLRPSSPSREVASKEKMAFPLPDKPSIAVLPFVNMSEDPKQEYFSDGMTEDLITDLSKISGLLVIARNSTFTYKGKPVKVKQVAEEFGVRYVLEGSVRRAGDEIRINAQLIDALSGNHLWAERYDGKMDRVFALQDQITQKIVSALAVKLTGTEEQIIAQKGTDNIAAYDAYLEGMDHYYRYTPDSFGKAAASFKKAIELDPNYGQAYAALANVHSLATLSTALLPGLKISWLEARLRMREYIQMAMKKPTSSAYAVSSEMYLYRRQHKEAISELERGLSLNPNSAACHGDMGLTLTWAGKPKEGIEYLNKWIRLDPRARYRYLRGTTWAHFWMGETAEAANLSEQALRLNPENLSAAVELAGFYGALGRDQDARAMLEIRKKGANPPTELWQVLRQNPFSDRTVADRYARGLLKAGLPPGKVSGGYFPAFKENQLTGEEIKKLLFGSKITGIDLFDGQQWWTDCKKNGECTWRGSGPISSDTGMSRIEDDMICSQYQKRLWALEYCGTVFRNPGGKHGSKDEYFLCSDIGPIPFSLVK